MQSVLDSTYFDEFFSPSFDFFIMAMLTKMLNLEICIWCENDLHTFVRLFKSYDMNVRKVVSILPKNFDRIDDTEIITPQQLFAAPIRDKFFFINSLDYAPVPANQIVAALTQNHCIGVYVLTPTDTELLLGYKSVSQNFDSNRISYYQSHKAELMQFFELLADVKSKQILVEYLRSYILNVTYKGEQVATQYKYFFGSKDEQLYKHLQEECWINCGAAFGDTICAFLSWHFPAKKIYAFEGNPNTYQRLLRTLSMLPADKRAMIEPINAIIDQTTNFEKILSSGGGRCTLLNADIEGSEMALLTAMADVIRTDRPVIAICVYHLKEDLVVIPQYLRSICKDYVYHLRKYNQAWIGNYKQNHELVLYAIPRERSTIGETAYEKTKSRDEIEGRRCSP